MILTGREIVYVIGDYPAPLSGHYPCGQTEPTTTADIAALGGGGGISPGPATPIVSGASYTTVPLTDVFLVWQSGVSAPKTTIITSAGMISGQVITIKDRLKNFGTLPCTLVPADPAVTIDDEVNFVMETDGMAVSLKWVPASNNFCVF